MTAEERPLLAGELALGLLDGEERAEALRLVLADRDFARAVEGWRDHFATLFAELPEVTPDAGLETRIMDALFGAGAPGRGDPATVSTRALGVWRTVAGAAMLAAAALLAVVLMRPERVLPPRPSAPVAAPAPLIAVLTPTEDGNANGAAPLAAVIDRRVGSVTLAGTLAVPAGRVAQLWTIGADGAPRSLGVLSGDATRLAVEPARRAQLTPAAVLAISIEPTGGSTTGAPTGPVIATGPLATA